ncbi:hypothetical protein [Pedobacter jeongneungensis]|uniref:hypothetical protein n=1 Tax=Pedobacter jeongneungensis TaxID=947309 RepID=UPI00046A97FD|nr:hypothetical protein [Pedobacter jeongneungensis]
MIEEIAKKIKLLGKQDTDTTIMTVKAVDKKEGTCTCDENGVLHTDVRLSAIIDEKLQKYYLYPKVGSTVLVTPIDADYNMQFISAVSEPEELVLQIGEVVFEINKDGFLLQKNNETLKALMMDLIKEIKAMKFTTNAGPTIALVNTPQFSAIENRFEQFLKDN